MNDALNIYIKAFNKDYECDKSELKEYIKNGTHRLLIYKKNNIVIGGAIITNVQPNRHIYYLEYLFVDSSTRGQGIGSKLLNCIIDLCKKENVKTLALECKIGLVNWYKRFGGVICDIKKSRFDDEGEKYAFMFIPISTTDIVIMNPLDILFKIRMLHGDKLDGIIGDTMIWKPILYK